jgi:hypothetical protein
MRKVSTVLLAAICGIAMFGCVTTFRPEPEGAEDLLVMGLYELRYAVPQFSFGSTRTESVDLVAENTATGHRTKISAVSGTPMLVGRGMTAGEYRLTEFEMVTVRTIKLSGGGTITEKGMTQITFVEPIVFEVEAGCVNNFGRMVFLFTDDGGVRLAFERDYLAVRNAFSDRYTDSLWNTYDWKNVRL